MCASAQLRRFMGLILSRPRRREHSPLHLTVSTAADHMGPGARPKWRHGNRPAATTCYRITLRGIDVMNTTATSQRPQYCLPIAVTKARSEQRRVTLEHLPARVSRRDGENATNEESAQSGSKAAPKPAQSFFDTICRNPAVSQGHTGSVEGPSLRLRSTFKSG